jgi:hypothetical protein
MLFQAKNYFFSIILSIKQIYKLLKPHHIHPYPRIKGQYCLNFPIDQDDPAVKVIFLYSMLSVDILRLREDFLADREYCQSKQLNLLYLKHLH